MSAALGWAAPALISKTYTHYLAVALFFFFGLRSLYESLLAWEGGGMQEELEETEKELGAKGKKKTKTKTKTSAFLSSTLVETFVITFLAEWGDRSQITTIALAAHKNPYGVAVGGTIGHAFCTGLAVVGGRIIALKISQRLVAVAGGLLFFVSAFHALVYGAPGSELGTFQ